MADASFGLNHSKNYLGFVLAVFHEEPTDAVVEERVVGAVDDAARGAAFLGLVEEGPRGRSLTPLGREVVRLALDEYASVDAALDAFAEWKGSSRRFCELALRWGLLVRRVLWEYPATQLLVEELQHMHDDGIASPSLVDIVEYLHALHPSITVELFVRRTDDARERVLAADGEWRRSALLDGAVFHSPTVFLLKAMFFHAGFLTERGAEPSNLDPEADVWSLRAPVDAR